MIALAVTEFAGVTHLFRGQQATPGYAVDPDRRAAEWVLSIGGVVKINETQTEIKAAADLPKEAFTLSPDVYLGNNEKVNDADLARLKDCGNLTWLDLNETKVSARFWPTSRIAASSPEALGRWTRRPLNPAPSSARSWPQAAQYTLSSTEPELGESAMCPTQGHQEPDASCI